MGIAAVTGSASGIGAAVREHLEKQGDRVIGVDLKGAEVEADLSTAAGRQQALRGLREAAGDGLDRLVLCAGLGAHLEDLAQIPSVNYFGAVELLDGLLEAMQGRPAAAAVAICSNSAQFAPFDEHPYVLALLEHDEAGARKLIAAENGFVAYSGSKHALARALRRRAGPWGKAGVRLNGIAPGATETPMLTGTIEHPLFGKGLAGLEVPLGRRARPAEIAGVIGFLLSEAAGYIHGSIVYADGGNDAMVRPDRF